MSLLSENKIMVECSKGHRFPVNLNKHTDRRYVMCPRCKEEINVRKEHWFEPNPDWQKIKEEQAGMRREMKAKAKRG